MQAKDQSSNRIPRSYLFFACRIFWIHSNHFFKGAILIEYFTHTINGAEYEMIEMKMVNELVCRFIGKEKHEQFPNLVKRNTCEFDLKKERKEDEMSNSYFESKMKVHLQILAQERDTTRWNSKDLAIKELDLKLLWRHWLFFPLMDGRDLKRVQGATWNGCRMSNIEL